MSLGVAKVQRMCKKIVIASGAKQSPSRMEKQFYVYILTNRHHTVLYTGVTSDLSGRIYQHRTKALRGFTSRYNVDKLVYYEATDDVTAAIAREKQIKAGARRKKIELVDAMNPEWRDLSLEF